MPSPLPYQAELAARADRDHANRRAQRALFKLHSRLRRTRTGCMDAMELGLTCAHLRVLEVLSERPDSNISEIARILDLSRQAVHRVVHLLADRGFLCLEKTRRSDRRAIIPRLCEIARLCAVDAITWQRNFLDALTAGFRLHDLQFTAMAIDRIWRHFTPDLAAAEP